MRKIFIVLVLLSVLVAAGSSASTATADTVGARSLGDNLVRRLLQTKSCTARSRHLTFGHGASYLASCTGEGGDFRFIVTVPVKPGGLNVNTSYIRGRIDDICAGNGGAVFSAGVKDRFAAMYLGRGDDTEQGTAAHDAATLYNGLTSQLGTESGAFHSGLICANGTVTKRVS